MAQVLARAVQPIVGMEPIEVQRAVRSIFVTLVLGAVALVLMAAVSDRLLLRARPIHRPPIACVTIPAEPRERSEAVPAAEELEVVRDAPAETVVPQRRARPPRKAERTSPPGQAPSKLRQQLERCGDNPLCGIDESGTR